MLFHPQITPITHGNSTNPSIIATPPKTDLTNSRRVITFLLSADTNNVPSLFVLPYRLTYNAPPVIALNPVQFGLTLWADVTACRYRL
jgi:hypothetical protein